MNAATGGRAQGGFSLVELMVAMVVALVLLAGILQMLLGNRQSFDVQKSMAELQEKLRLTSFVFDNTLDQAGYRQPGELDDPAEVLFPPETDSTGRGLAIARGAFVAGHDGGDQTSDAVRVRFSPNPSARDCLGKDNYASGASKPIDFALYVKHDSATDTSALYCAVYSSGAPPQPLVNNVVRFTVRYGLDTDSDGSVDRYYTPDNASLSPTRARQVRSLRLQLLLASAPGVKIAPRPLKRHFLFADTSEVATDPDQRAYVLVDKTVALRNVLP